MVEKELTFDPIKVSVVVPVYSGEAYLAKLVEEVRVLREAYAEQLADVAIVELIMVDDAARDGSSSIIDQLSDAYPWVVALHLSRNYGQHPATIAGILHTSGDWIVTLDEDLQHPPSRITDLLIRAFEEKADVVYARPISEVHEAAIRDVTSRTVKKTIGWMTGEMNLSAFNSFRLINGDVARAAASVCSHDTYFDMNLSWFSQRVSTVAMPLKDERYVQDRTSGYNFRSLARHARRLLLSSHLKVIDGFTFIGLFVVLSAIIGAGWVISVKVFAPDRIDVAGWPSLILSICFFGGLLTSMLGVGLQYLSTLVLKAHGKPTFFTIRRRFGDNILISLRGLKASELSDLHYNQMPNHDFGAASHSAECS
jgi:glycosyltransferase involved in cell wall biosynthesis